MSPDVVTIRAHWASYGLSVVLVRLLWITTMVAIPETRHRDAPAAALGITLTLLGVSAASVASYRFREVRLMKSRRRGNRVC